MAEALYLEYSICFYLLTVPIYTLLHIHYRTQTLTVIIKNVDNGLELENNVNHLQAHYL